MLYIFIIKHHLEMTSACVPGDGAQGGVGGVAQQGGAPPLRHIVWGAGEQTREQRPSHQGERVWGEEVT